MMSPGPALESEVSFVFSDGDFALHRFPKADEIVFLRNSERSVRNKVISMTRIVFMSRSSLWLCVRQSHFSAAS